MASWSKRKNFMIILSFFGFGLILLGLIFIVSGIVGLFRFQGFYRKIHAAGVVEGCGIPLALIGLSLLQPDLVSASKLILIALLIFLLNPVSTHSLAKASIPYKIDSTGRLKD